jgi:phenylacetate-CoA ligase
MRLGSACWRSDSAVESASVPDLQRLVLSAATDVPFYRELWRQAGVDARRLRLPHELSALPVIRKADLLGVPIPNRVGRPFQHSSFVTERSSGSTGQPFEMRLSSDTMRRRRQRFMRALFATGYWPGRRLMLVATRRASPAMRLLRWTYADLRDDESSLLQTYLTVQPGILYAPLSSLLILAQQLEREGLRPDHKAKLISKAEPLRTWQCQALTRILGTSVTDFYGMTELGLVAFRQPEDRAYRIPRFTFVLEFLPVPGSQSEERLIVTDLSNISMPIIRYDTGDLVRRDHSLPGAPIVEFSGRSVDRVILPDGTLVSPLRIEAGIEEIGGIERFQVTQTADLDLHADVWTSGSDSTTTLQRVETFLREICRDTVAVGVSRRTDSPNILTGEKLRPVRSLARTQ